MSLRAHGVKPHKPPVLTWRPPSHETPPALADHADQVRGIMARIFSRRGF